MTVRRRVFFVALISMCANIAPSNDVEVPSVPYVLPDAELSHEIAKSQREHRGALLTERWTLVKRAVAHYRVTDWAFTSSVTYWSHGWLPTGDWSLKFEGEIEGTPDLPPAPSVLVEGDCREDLIIQNGHIVHVQGDLHSQLELVGENGQPELVIAGSVSKDAVISADGIVRIFVGGDFDGTIQCTGSLKIWILGDMNGSISTGSPSTRLCVIGDYEGTVQPIAEAHLLSLDVRGFASGEALNAISQHGYTEFVASIGSSDLEPGFHGGRSSTSIVHRQR